MNIPQAETISVTRAQRLISDAVEGRLALTYLPKKHQLILEDKETWLAKLYLPWTMDWTSSYGLEEKADSHYSLVVIRAGQASVGYFHQGKLLDHKSFRAYMVRQKQGVSQIKHLKTKGKSRAGSRVRLAETERFFEEINERLISYSDRFPIDFWGISCAKTMWPYYFDAAISPPFSQKDENLIELPGHISRASFEELEQVGTLCNQVHLIVSQKGKSILDLGEMDNSADLSQDNW